MCFTFVSILLVDLWACYFDDKVTKCQQPWINTTPPRLLRRRQGNFNLFELMESWSLVGPYGDHGSLRGFNFVSATLSHTEAAPQEWSLVIGHGQATTSFLRPWPRMIHSQSTGRGWNRQSRETPQRTNLPGCAGSSFGGA